MKKSINNIFWKANLEQYSQSSNPGPMIQSFHITKDSDKSVQVQNRQRNLCILPLDHIIYSLAPVQTFQNETLNFLYEHHELHYGLPSHSTSEHHGLHYGMPTASTKPKAFASRTLLAKCVQQTCPL